MFPRIPRLPSAAMIAALSCMTGFGLVGSPAAADPTFRDFPVVIYCEHEHITNAYYFSQLGPDGKAIYLTPDRQAGVISVAGVAEHLDGERVGSCRDKTLDDLRASGQAFDLSQ
ncbi:hypothetical protein RGQ15_19805 [Paracoccus sp. MBLB3053]|uniref:Lysozyme inhibitor n=1 Tax=Paracoccus aurantius TaxID=3073814 RepID=A0ABU2HXM3_9RHOB|nr:hypothetical protein [Paracoccus sp. MBLB3053]MDS9469807.1 hypothetical protein [Paracoccus sp. MBLB3053]